MTAPTPPRHRLFTRLSLPEGRFLARALRTETVGGALLLAAAVLALIWSNSPWHESYAALRDFRIGPTAVHLDLSLGQWAADGLLAIFFLVAGIELKREFIAGDLSDRAKAAVPITAAVAGVALPALLYAVSVTVLGGDSDALTGWAIPTATDIAFALAVLAVIGSNLPSALRSFLLTLAVVDDLIAITIIAIFYTSSLAWLPLVGALIPIAIFGWMLRRGITQPAVLAIPALTAWVLVHEAGVHATVAGVLLGLAVPVNRREELAAAGDDDRHTLAETVEHALRPFSAGVAVPVFAFFAAGVRFVGGGLEESWRDPAAIGIVVGLMAGKAIGVFGATWAVARFTRAELDAGLGWLDVLGLALLSGLGFTVSLLIGELAYGAGSERDDHVKLAVLVGSLLAAVFAAIILKSRDRYYRRLAAIDDEPDAAVDVPTP